MIEYPESSAAAPVEPSSLIDAPGPNGSRIGFGDVRGRITPA